MHKRMISRHLHIAFSRQIVSAHSWPSLVRMSQL